MRNPKCPYFNSCGGCDTQHLAYQEQLKNKANRLAKAIKYDDIQIFSDQEYFYRNRMDLAFHKGGLGFRRKGSWLRIVDVEQCVISNPELNQLLTEVRTYFDEHGYDAYSLREKTGTFRYAVIRTPKGDSSISFVVNSKSPDLQAAYKKVEDFSKKSSAKNILITHESPESDRSTGNDYKVIKGSDELTGTYLGKPFQFFGARVFSEQRRNGRKNASIRAWPD
ncbi:hypothetical protein IPJ72_03345 [Candidatus Peregrinibacteria bacterium]|nr:MAG: hypothetical protein IPJ72_03345 [Candidatus Peregrinibacteria bacterium]